MPGNEKQARKREENLERLFEDFPDLGEPFSPELEAWLRDTRRVDHEELERAVAENAKELLEAGVDDVASGHSFTLTKEHPEVSLVARPWAAVPEWLRRGPNPEATRRVGNAPPLLVVTGLGPYAGKRAARVGVVDMTAFDLSNRVIAKIGITSDGKMILPVPAGRVFFRLRDLKRTATVALDRSNRLHYDEAEPIPQAWLVRKEWKPPTGDAISDDE